MVDRERALAWEYFDVVDETNRQASATRSTVRLQDYERPGTSNCTLSLQKL